MVDRITMLILLNNTRGFIHPTEPSIYSALHPIYKIYKQLHNYLLVQLIDTTYEFDIMYLFTISWLNDLVS